jgi:hypothetical protein
MEAGDQPAGAGDRLKGWKEIASFFHVKERTVQRWERSLHLPVHRIETERGAIVFASRDELQAWLRSAEGRVAKPAQDADVVQAGTEHLEHDALSQPPWSVPTAPTGSSAKGQPDGDIAGTRYPVRKEQVGDEEAASSPHSRRFLWWSLAAGFALIAVVATGMLQGRQPTDSTATGSGGAAGSSSRESMSFRVILSTGRSFKMKVSPGSVATCALPSGAVLALSVEPTETGATVRVYRIEPATSAAIERRTGLAVLSLAPGGRTRLAQPSEVSEIEWLPSAAAGSAAQ